MEIKQFEIRDEATFIPVVAIRISGKDGYLARRAGYGVPCILLTSMHGGRSCYDPYEWDSRTFTTAHNYIWDNWDSLQNEDVVDVQYILKETSSPKVSERFSTYGE